MAKFIEITAEVWSGLDGSIRSESICYINIDLIKYYHQAGDEKTKVVFGEGVDNFIIVMDYVGEVTELIESAGGEIIFESPINLDKSTRL